MNNHDIDIELPPLPEFDRLSSMHADDVANLLSSYGRKCARAAIEADCKRTAELLKNPVHVHSNMCRGIIAPITFDMLAHVLGEEATNEWLRKRRGEPVAWIRKNGFRFISEIEPQDDSEVPLYAAPQPAEQSSDVRLNCNAKRKPNEHSR